MTITTYTTKFAIGDAAICDGDESIKMHVVGVAFYTGRSMISVEWTHNGALQQAWLDQWRLTEVDR